MEQITGVAPLTTEDIVAVWWHVLEVSAYECMAEQMLGFSATQVVEEMVDMDQIISQERISGCNVHELKSYFSQCTGIWNNRCKNGLSSKWTMSQRGASYFAGVC